jgi:hypothetical protein
MDSLTTENPLTNAPSSIEWLQHFELGYDEPEPKKTLCFSCSAMAEKFSKCASCNVAAYCSRECQVKDWKGGRHKLGCPGYSRLADFDKDEIKAQVRTELFARIRFYACPYAVHKSAELGRGFLFVQSDATLKELSIAIPKDITGRIAMRGILLHYLTLGEFDAELCKDDFELTSARSKLQEAVNAYDDETEVVLLWRLRCGHVALGKAVLVPDYNICKQLGKEYYADNPAGAIQLNLDDL